MREGGEDYDKGMVSDVEGVQSVVEGDVEFHEGWDVCLCGGGGGGVDGSSGSSGVGDSSESIKSIVYWSGRGGGSIVYRSIGDGLYRSH